MKTEKQSAARRAVEASILLSIGSIASSLFGLLTVIVIFRSLSPNEYGLLTLALTIAGLLAYVLPMGIDQSLSKFIPEYLVYGDYGKVKRVIITAFEAVFLVGLVSSVALFLCSDGLAFHMRIPEAAPLMKVASLGILATLIGMIAISTFQAFQKFSYLVIFQLTGSIITLTLILALLRLGFGVIGMLTGIVAANFIVCAFELIVLLNIYGRQSGYLRLWDLDIFREIFSFSKFVLITNLIKPFFNRIEILLLGIFRGATELGFFSAAFNLTDTVHGWFVTGISGALYPILSESFASNDLKTFKHLIESYIKYVIYLTFPICAGLILLATPILSVVASSKYLPAVFIFQILTCRIIIGCVTAIGAPSGLLAMGKADTRLKMTAAMLFMDFLLAIILIPLYGAVGAAVTTLIVYLTSMLLTFGIIQRTLTIRIPFFPIVKSIFSTIAMGLAIFLSFILLNSDLLRVIIGIGVGAVIYSLTLVLCGGFTKQDVLFFRKLLPSTYFGILLNFLDKFAK